ncbi:endo alpha-1,4 polygalactosaminidase [Streptomyces sp. CMB-StM0423]|uniref:endo alpha-1,4 polygalactosaminidase n=1 Tax=Streptomyces sp. CMB-StM0423 TaxID=2059884 RepID=UPI000D198A48
MLARKSRDHGNTGWEGERSLDLRGERCGAFGEIVWARLGLAARMGCDGVEYDRNGPGQAP